LKCLLFGTGRGRVTSLALGIHVYSSSQRTHLPVESAELQPKSANFLFCCSMMKRDELVMTQHGLALSMESRFSNFDIGPNTITSPLFSLNSVTTSFLSARSLFRGTMLQTKEHEHNRNIGHYTAGRWHRLIQPRPSRLS